MPTRAFVPLKSPQLAKSRLAAVLAPAERQALFFTLASRVLDALAGTPDIVDVVVVTANDEVAAFAEQHRARSLRLGDDLGTAQACAEAQRRIGAFQGGTLMIAGDLPAASPSALQQLLAALDSEAEVFIVPDRHGRGTNALLYAEGAAIEPCFGPDSCARHLAAAARAGLRATRLDIPELAFDVDVPADLDSLYALDGGFAVARISPVPRPPVLRPRRAPRLIGAAL